MTPTPCGVCSACREIDEGRFVDLIEVDAASRTKVDDTRELLDNVQYAPARGRYKVYLIDEVHMLSTHSFNALLKTLEEPPPHVKFLLATTDPQKLPVTVLSRCLQFNLKRFPPGMIFKRLSYICEQETIAFEPDALRLVARAAEGSMRDALSLLDQVLAFGGGKLTAEDTRTMLGSLDRGQVFGIVEALSARDARKVLEHVNDLDEHAPDYREVLAELAALLQKLALLQAVPDMQLDEAEDVERYKKLAAAISPEDTQLFYQIAIVGRRDLELAPDVRGGFEMVLLRMLAFGMSDSAQAPSSAPTPIRTNVAGTAPAAVRAAPASASASSSAANAPTMASNAAAPQAAPSAPQAALAAEGDWAAMVTQMNLNGIVRQLAAHCTFQGRHGTVVKLALDPEGEHYRTAMMEDKLAQALTAYYGQPVRPEFTVSSAAAANTPARQMKAAAEDRVQNARASIETDPNVRAMREIFGATVTPDSIRPNDN
jgi:DNA polymerase III subunit gamma/tau